MTPEPRIEIREDVPLAPFTSFRIGGPARFFAVARSEAELLEAVRFQVERRLALFVLGGGSNVLMSDEGFDGLVVRLAIEGEIEREGNLVHVPAGVEWDALVRQMCVEGRCGMECLAGIPGLVGASPIQNIGAYGQEVAETVAAVRVFDREEGRFRTLTRAECGFGYRESIFNTTARERYVLTAVTFALDPAAVPKLEYADLRMYFADWARVPTAMEVYDAVRAIRHGKGMLLVAGEADCRSAGSFFKNPVVALGALARIAEGCGVAEAAIPQYPAGDGWVKLPAAWLLERAGFHKGYGDGDAGISSRHTLALINRGNAGHRDIARLRDGIVATVEGRFGIVLRQEPVEPRG